MIIHIERTGFMNAPGFFVLGRIVMNDFRFRDISICQKDAGLQVSVEWF